MGFHFDHLLVFMLYGLYTSIPKLMYAAGKQTNKPNHSSQVTVTHLKKQRIAFRGMSIKSNID